MEKARCNTELYSNLSEPLNNVKPSNFWGSHQNEPLSSLYGLFPALILFSFLSETYLANAEVRRPLFLYGL